MAGAKRKIRSASTGASVGASDAELTALEAFLRSPSRKMKGMSVSGIDGYLTALVIGPEMVMPSDYLPWIWDEKKGKASPGFADLDEADRYLGIVMRMNNRIAGELMQPSPRLPPLFLLDERWSPRAWTQGFCDGIMFDEEAWDVLATDHEDWLARVLAASAADGKDRLTVARAGVDVAELIVPIRDYFREGSWRERLDRGSKGAPTEPVTPFVRSGPKVGRNNPCPCGSGKKSKKCCGDAPQNVH